MFDDNQIAELMDKKFGWLSPNNELVICTLYSHLEALSNSHLLDKKMRKRYLDHINLIEEERQKFEENIPEDEHPSWHVYECWEYDEVAEFNKSFLTDLYAMGWIRIGCITRIAKRNVITGIEFESNKEVLNNKSKFLKEISFKIGLDDYKSNVFI